MNYIDEEDLQEYLETKNWSYLTVKERMQSVCQVAKEKLTEDDVWKKYGNYSYSTRARLRLGICLLREFREWDKNVNKNR